MRKMTRYLLSTMLCSVLMSGCATKWEPSWHETAKEIAPAQTEADKIIPVPAESLENIAREKFNAADTKEKLLDSIEAYKNVLRTNPANIEMLTGLGGQYILLGTAYTDGKSAKAKNFKLARQYAELAMYTNPDFKKQADAGATPWEAAGTITDREMEAALLWVTALQYEFKECMGLLAKVMNVRNLQHTLLLMKRVEEIDPNFGGGAVDLALSISYFSLPGSMGGDDALGEKYMQKAAQKNKDWLVGRWARGKYYEDLSGKTEGTKEDLEWVASQDISEYKDPYPWRVHFRDNARDLLGQ